MSALDRSAGGLKMTELSDALRVSNGNVTGIVDRLVDGGLVERQAVEGDRRAQLICLTKTGKTTFARYAKTHERWVDELMAGLPPEEAEQLISLLEHTLTPEDQKVS
jgi:DNA-binding MarR family transcriptional regulator